MEDYRWKVSAEQWETAYKMVRADRDTLELKIKAIRDIALGLKPGCHCQCDYDCSNCQEVAKIQKILGLQ